MAVHYSYKGLSTIQELHIQTTHHTCGRVFFPRGVFYHLSDITKTWWRIELAVHLTLWNSEFLLSSALLKQPKLRADTGCSSPVNFPEDHILLWVNIHYVLNPITHLPTISSAIYQDGIDHCGSPLGWAVPAVIMNAAPGTEKRFGLVFFFNRHQEVPGVTESLILPGPVWSKKYPLKWVLYSRTWQQIINRQLLSKCTLAHMQVNVNSMSHTPNTL